MQYATRQRAREITDREIIRAMLDAMDTIHVGIHDEPAPYVVPLNFGYAMTADALVFVFHCAQAGYKLELLARNPNVCVTATQFISYAEGSVKGHLHDYRSVIARGVASRIDPEQDEEAFDRAHVLLLEHNHRTMQPGDAEVARFMQLWRIVCPWEQVTAKAEIVPRCVQDVAFAPAGGDGVPLDESHIDRIHVRTD